MAEKIILIAEEEHQPQVELLVNDDVEVSVTNIEVGMKTIENVAAAEPVSEIAVDISESMGWVGGDTNMHYSLAGRDDPDQHTIGAITGLERRLAVIEALKTVYSDSIGVANYYAWNSGESAEHGYFVSLVPKTATIKVCDGKDIFGVTVANAGFVGGQDGTTLNYVNGVTPLPGHPRDDKYGLVMTSGLVDVRCELNVEVGDYVMANSRGYAEKTESRSGYKVLAKEVKDGVKYVVILLGVQADITDALDKALQLLDTRMDNAEIDIAAAMNLANEAYKMAAECIAANKIAQDKVCNMEFELDDMRVQVGDASLLSVQAKAIADNALLYAEDARLKAVTAANQALQETAQFRDELKAQATNMSTALGNAALELQATKESIVFTKNELQGNINDAVSALEALEKDLEPLATWPHGVGMDRAESFAGFVARADQDGAILGAMVGRKGEEGETLAGFIQKATEAEATVSGIASYKRKDADGNVVEPGGAAGLLAQVDANQAVVETVAALDGGIAGLDARVNDNTSSVTTLASQTIGDYIIVEFWDVTDKDPNKIYYAKNTKTYYYFKSVRWLATKDISEAGLDGAIAGVKSVADANKAQFDAMASYDTNNGEKSALAGMTAYVDANSANFSELAKYDNESSGQSGIAGLVADVDSNTSALSLVAEHSFTDDNNVTHTGLAGLQAQVNDNTSEVTLVANRVAGQYVVVETWSAENKQPDTVYYAKDTKLYWYYDTFWKATDDAYTAGLPSAIAGVQVETDDHSAKIENITSWQGETNVAMASIKQTADANGASIRLFVADIDKYSVGPYSQAYGFTLEQAQDVLEEGMIYVPTPHKNSNTHGEVYNYTVTDASGNEVVLPYPDANGYQFTPGNIYTWTDIDASPNTTNMMWKESIGLVALFPIEPSIATYEFWYKDGGDNSDGYDPYTLYKRNTYTDDKGNTLTRWIAVATLRGNYSNRATSSIRQDANSIALDVTNVKGSVATIQQTVSENSADIALVVSDGGVNTASIVNSVNNAGSNISINADKIAMTGTAVFLKPGDLGLNSTIINGSTILTGYINANHIDANSLKVNAANVTGQLKFGSNTGYFIDVNNESDLYVNLPNFFVTKTLGCIGGFYITSNALYNGKTTFASTDSGVYVGTNGISCGSQFSVDTDGVLTSSFLISGNWLLRGAGLSYTDRVNQKYLFDLQWNKMTTQMSATSSMQLFWEVYDSVALLGSKINDAYDAYIWFYGGALLSGTWMAESCLGTASDSNVKNSIAAISDDDRYDLMFDALTPSVYKYNNGTSGRVHTGYIAQEVLAAMEVAGLSTSEFAGYMKNSNDSCYLRYEEFIPLNTYQIQKLKSRVSMLEEKVEELESKLKEV